MKRHAKLLTKSAKRFALVFAALFAAAALTLHFYPGLKPDANELIMNYLPYFLFVLYFANRGSVITQAMFLNCDHSMLAYRAYRQPKAILTLFVERLKYVILINLMPAGVIGLGLPLLLYLSGGTTQPLNYAVLFVSIIAMSVFFSVHSMVLYYLLQPYNVNLLALCDRRHRVNAATIYSPRLSYFLSKGQRRLCRICQRMQCYTRTSNFLFDRSQHFSFQRMSRIILLTRERYFLSNKKSGCATFV